jgi:hypothetical protein
MLIVAIFNVDFQISMFGFRFSVFGFSKIFYFDLKQGIGHRSQGFNEIMIGPGSDNGMVG